MSYSLFEGFNYNLVEGLSLDKCTAIDDPQLSSKQKSKAETDCPNQTVKEECENFVDDDDDTLLCSFIPAEQGAVEGVVTETAVDTQVNLNQVDVDVVDNFMSNMTLKLIADPIFNTIKKPTGYDAKLQLFQKDIKNIYDLGDPMYAPHLDFVEMIILSFLDLQDSQIKELFKAYCPPKEININVIIFLTIAKLYNSKSIGDQLTKTNEMYADTILNRLGRYVPEILQKVMIGLNTCDGAENKYIIINNIYKTLFKYNTTTVNLGVFDIFKQIMEYLKNLKTIEMVVVIIAIAFVLSKVFDMFKVNVAI